MRSGSAANLDLIGHTAELTSISPGPNRPRTDRQRQMTGMSVKRNTIFSVKRKGFAKKSTDLIQVFIAHAKINASNGHELTNFFDWSQFYNCPIHFHLLVKSCQN
jgi:hypothetical protein